MPIAYGLKYISPGLAWKGLWFYFVGERGSNFIEMDKIKQNVQSNLIVGECLTKNAV